MPKYLFMFMDGDASGVPAATLAAVEAKVGVWWETHAKAGRILGGERLAPPSTATTVRQTPKGPVVTDGPYLEAKELIGGYGLVEVPSLDEAIAMAKTWPVGTVEIRPLGDM